MSHPTTEELAAVYHVAPALADLLVPIASLKLDKANARKHSARNLDSIAESYRTFGQQKPIIYGPDRVVVAGNGQLAAAQKLGWTHIAAVATNLTGPALRAFALADNRTAELAEWDDEALAKALAAIQNEDPLLVQAVGFSEAEIAELLGPKEGLTDPDAVPDPPKKAITRLGDLWLLGDHRLLCGDSTKAEDTARLMNGAKTALVFTDPPYGAAFDGSNRPSEHSRQYDEILQNDESELDLVKAFASSAVEAMDSVLSPGGVIYVCGMMMNYCPWRAAFERHFKLRAIPIWVKDNPAAGRSDFFWGYEIIFYGTKEGAKHKWRGGRGPSDVWPFSNPNSFGYVKDDGSRNAANDAQVHPTQKPTDLVRHALTLSSDASDSTVDLFCGSGTTLLASEQLHRRCYAMEIEPRYCDVAVRRWEEFTGKKAMREEAP